MSVTTSPAAPATVQTSNEYMKPIANAIAAKDWKTVATLAEQQLRQEPQRWQLYAPLGQAQLMLGNYDEALWSLALGIAGGQKEAAAATEPKRLAALNATRELIAGYAKLDPAVLSRTLAVTCKTSYAASGSQASPSTVGREAMYAVAHAVHHYALIGIMAGIMNIKTPAGFGVAPSTLKHQQTVAA